MNEEKINARIAEIQKEANNWSNQLTDMINDKMALLPAYQDFATRQLSRCSAQIDELRWVLDNCKE